MNFQAHLKAVAPALGQSISDAASLRAHLQIALQLELSTIPPYLCALYSIRDGENLEVSGLIRSVVMEEMLHLLLAANVLNAIGGQPVLARKGVTPEYPATLPDSDQSFVVNLLPLKPEAITTFKRIELPAAPAAPPQSDGYSTIGQFYEAIEEALTRLSAEGAITFDNRPGYQVGPEEYYNGHGEVFVVNSLKAALDALNEIRHQGEGIEHSIADSDLPFGGDDVGYHLAHYFRFVEIGEGRRFRQGDTPKTGPSGPLLPLDWAGIQPMATNPRAEWCPAGSPERAMMDACNMTWKNLLLKLEQSFNGQPTYLREAVPLMMQLKEQSISLMRIPFGDEGKTLGPGFEWVD